MSNDITEAITEQQSYRERKREKCLEKVEIVMEKIKKGYKI